MDILSPVVNKDYNSESKELAVNNKPVNSSLKWKNSLYCRFSNKFTCTQICTWMHNICSLFIRALDRANSQYVGWGFFFWYSLLLKKRLTKASKEDLIMEKEPWTCWQLVLNSVKPQEKKMLKIHYSKLIICCFLEMHATPAPRCNSKVEW